jgi:hypothetical protein
MFFNEILGVLKVSGILLILVVTFVAGVDGVSTDGLA